MKLTNRGYTMIELLAVLFIFTLLAGLSSRLLVFSSSWFERQQKSMELFDSGRMAVDFTVNHIKYAHGYKLRTLNNKETLYQLELYITDNTEHTYILRYDDKSKQLRFGGKEDYSQGVANELSSGIEDIVISVSAELMYITVTTEDGGVFEATADISTKEAR